MKKRPRTRETIAANVRMLIAQWPMPIDDLAKKSGVTKRMIHYILNGERAPSVEVAEALAIPFGLSGWQLLMPSLDVEMARAGRLRQLVDRYRRSSGKERRMFDVLIDQPADNDSEYSEPPPTPPEATSRLDSVKSTVTSRAAKKGGRDANKK